jgi:predicted MFS family arabinose efflux permease
VDEKNLPLVFLCGGLCTLVSMNLVGRWADRAGKRHVFTIVSLTTAAPILAFTNLPKVPLAAALTVSTILMICMSGRMVPAMAMMTAAIEARDRGGFMSINSAVQQLSMGFTSVVGGMILGENNRGEMTHFPVNGILAITLAYTCIYLAGFLKKPADRNVPIEPLCVETI